MTSALAVGYGVNRRMYMRLLFAYSKKQGVELEKEGMWGALPMS
jgi:hypothetical protein